MYASSSHTLSLSLFLLLNIERESRERKQREESNMSFDTFSNDDGYVGFGSGSGSQPFDDTFSGYTAAADPPPYQGGSGGFGAEYEEQEVTVVDVSNSVSDDIFGYGPDPQTTPFMPTIPISNGNGKAYDFDDEVDRILSSDGPMPAEEGLALREWRR